MLDRNDFLELVQGAYAARVRGDKEALSRYWSADAHFAIVGDPALFENLSLSAPTPMTTIGTLIDRFAFSDMQMLDAVVEGGKAAIRWVVTISAGDKAPVTTQLFDMIELGEDDKIRSFLQYTDTALIRHLAG